MDILTNILGWCGTVLIVLAYYLVSNKKVDSTGALYQWMNLLGAIGIGVNVFYRQAWPSVALEIVWGGIALVALVKMARN